MSPTSEIVLERERTGAAGDERWPLLWSALLVVALSTTLWLLILAGVGWLVA